MFDNTWEIKLVHEYKVEQMNREMEYKRVRKRHFKYYVLLRLARHIKSLGYDLEVKYEKKIKQIAVA